MRKRAALAVIAVLLLAGCGGADPTGVVDGHFRLPGRPAVDLQRAGLNFSRGAHGHGNGETVRVGRGGRYAVTLSPGSYSVIGALAGGHGGAAPETCDATARVIVTAHHTTRADFVCHATPVNIRN